MDVPFLSGQISSKCFKSRDGRSLSIGMQYLKSKSYEFATVRTQRNQTISPVIYPSVASLATYERQNFAQSRALLYSHPQIRASRGKRNRRGLERRVRARCHARHAAAQVRSSRSAITNKNKPAEPLVKARAEPG